MGQHLSNFYNPQFLQGLANALPQQSAMGAMGQTAGQNALQGMAQQVQGVDPRMMAQAQQQVSDPNAGDAVSILPGPKELAIGAVGGVVTASALAASVGTDNFNGPLTKFAQKLDSWIGPNHLSRWMQKQYKHAAGRGGLREVTHHAAATMPKGGNWQLEAQNAVKAMEQRHVKMVMENFPKRFNSKQDDALRKAYQQFIEKDAEKIAAAYNAHVDKNFANKIEGLTENTQAYKDTVAGHKARILDKKEQLFDFSKKDAKWLKQADNLTFDKSLNQVKAQVHYLEKVKEKLTPDEKKILERLRGFKERVGGLRNHYKPGYEAQARLTAKLAAEGTGPVGRTIAMGGQYLQRIFNGDTMRMGGKGFFGSLLGPAMAGGFIFGQSIQKASKAQKGEKTETFFHDLLGTGISNFVGWELGRKWLNSSGVMPKVLGRFATKRPFDNVIGGHLPIVGERFGKLVGNPLVKTFGENWFTKGVRGLLGTGLGGLTARLTLGGLATEIAAMLVFGTIFQKVGEGISHLIFGRPSKESLEGKAKQAQKQQEQYQKMAQQGGMPYNPAMAAGQPAQRTSFNGQGMTPQPAQPGMNPAYGYGQPQARQPMPQYSLSPEMISQSTAARKMQDVHNQIINDQSLNQKKSNGRENSFLTPGS